MGVWGGLKPAPTSITSEARTSGSKPPIADVAARLLIPFNTSLRLGRMESSRAIVRGMRHFASIAGLAAVLGAHAFGAGGVAPAVTDDWPQWRGPQGAGIG